MIANQTAPQEKMAWNRKLYNWFLKPSDKLQEPEDLRRARLLSPLTLVITALTTVRMFVGLSSGSFPADPSSILIIGLVVLCAGAYIFSRTTYLNVSSLLVVGALTFFSYGVVAVRGSSDPLQNLNSLLWIIPGFLLGSALFSWWAGTLWMIAVWVSLWLLPRFYPNIAFDDTLTGLFFTLFVTIWLVLIINRYRSQVEADRRDELLRANEELQTIRNSLEQRVADRTQALSVSAAVSQQLSTFLDPQQLVREVVAQVQQAFHYYHVHIYLSDEGKQELVMVGGTGEAGQTMLANNHKITAGRGLVGRAAATNQAVLIPDVSQDEDWLPNDLLPETKAEIAVPIAIGTQVLGVLDVQHNITNGLNKEDAALLQSLANQVAIALQNAQQYDQTQQSENRYRNILESIEQGYYETDLGGNFVFFNTALTHIFGYPAEELQDSHYKKYVDEANARKLLEAFNEVYATSESILGLEYEHIRQDGERRIINVSVTPILEADGRISGFRGLGRDVTTRRQAEAVQQQLTVELQETTSFLETIIDNLPVGLLLKDAQELRFTRWNSANAELIGLSREDVLGKNDHDLFPQEIADFFTAKDREVLEGGMLVDIPEEPVETAHKGTRILHTRKVPVLDTTGQPRYLLAISEDITERKRTETALQESEEKYRTILESIEDGYYETDLQGRFQFFNAAFCRIYGLEPEELRGMNYEPFTAEEDRERVYKVFNNVYHTGESVQSFEYGQVSTDGQHRIISLSISRMLDENGEPVGFRGLSRDVTEAKQMELSLRESEEKYRSILENMTDSYYEVDLGGHHIFFNKIFPEVLGYEAEDLLGGSYKMYVDEENAKKLFTNFNQVYKTGEPLIDLEYEIIRKDGSKRNLETSVSLVTDRAGEAFGFRGVNRDITERKKIQEEIELSDRMNQEFQEKLKALNEISVELSRIDDLNTLYEQIVYAGLFQLGFDRLGFFMAEDKDDPYHLYGAFGTDSKRNITDERGGAGWQVDENHNFRQLIDAKERILIHHDEGLYDGGEIVGYGWHMSVPVWVENEFFGLFVADNLTSQIPLKPYEPELLILFSTMAGNLVTRFLSNQALTKQAIEMETVTQVSVAISQTLQPDVLLQRVVDLTKERFDLYHAHIYLLNEENNSLLLTAGAGERGQQMVSERRSISMRQEKSIVARAARLKQGVISNDVRLELTFLPHPLLPDTRAEMAVPILLGERVLGVMDVQSAQVNAFTEQDVQTQTTLAAQVAVALQNSRLFVESEKTREELNVLTRRLTREGWQEYLDTATEEMAFAYGSTDDEDEVTVTAVAPLEKSLTIQGEPIGQLALADPRLMSDEADGIMAAVAERLSIHIENLRLTERSQTALSQSEEQARRLAALNEFSQTLNATTTMQEVFDVAVSGITGILPINRTSLTILDRTGGAFEVVAYSGEPSGMPAGRLLPVKGSPMGLAIQENRIVTGTTDDKIQSALFAPLVVGSRAVGTVNIGRLTANAFTGNDETLLAQIASLIGTRLENLRLLSDAQSRAERERQVRTITDRIRRASNKDMILQVAQEEIGKMLGAKETAVKLGTQQQLMATLKREKQNGA